MTSGVKGRRTCPTSPFMTRRQSLAAGLHLYGECLRIHFRAGVASAGGCCHPEIDLDGLVAGRAQLHPITAGAPEHVAHTRPAPRATPAAPDGPPPRHG